MFNPTQTQLPLPIVASLFQAESASPLDQGPPNIASLDPGPEEAAHHA